jgi:hypothetical protein
MLYSKVHTLTSATLHRSRVEVHGTPNTTKVSLYSSRAFPPKGKFSTNYGTLRVVTEPAQSLKQPHNLIGGPKTPLRSLNQRETNMLQLEAPNLRQYRLGTCGTTSDETTRAANNIEKRQACEARETASEASDASARRARERAA